MLANRLQQAERPLHVRAQERLGVGDGAVVVGLGGAVHDGVALRDKLVEKPGVADVAHNELDPVRRQPGNVLPPPELPGLGEPQAVPRARLETFAPWSPSVPEACRLQGGRDWPPEDRPLVNVDPHALDGD